MVEGRSGHLQTQRESPFPLFFTTVFFVHLLLFAHASLLEFIQPPHSAPVPSKIRIIWIAEMRWTGFYWVLLGLTMLYWVFLGFTRFYWVLLGFTVFYCILLGFTGYYWVLVGFTRFYWVLLGLSGF